MNYLMLILIITVIFGVIAFVSGVMAIASDLESEQRASALQSAKIFLALFIASGILNLILYVYSRG